MGLFGPTKLFRGTDSRLLLHTLEGLAAIHKRDRLAALPKKTAKISTREFMLDPENPELQAAFNLIYDTLHAQYQRVQGE